mgnify:CR=1 FL=1
MEPPPPYTDVPPPSYFDLVQSTVGDAEACIRTVLQTLDQDRYDSVAVEQVVQEIVKIRQLLEHKEGIEVGVRVATREAARVSVGLWARLQNTLRDAHRATRLPLEPDWDACLFVDRIPRPLCCSDSCYYTATVDLVNANRKCARESGSRSSVTLCVHVLVDQMTTRCIGCKRLMTFDMPLQDLIRDCVKCVYS